MARRLDGLVLVAVMGSSACLAGCAHVAWLENNPSIPDPPRPVQTASNGYITTPKSATTSYDVSTVKKDSDSSMSTLPGPKVDISLQPPSNSAVPTKTSAASPVALPIPLTPSFPPTTVITASDSKPSPAQIRQSVPTDTDDRTPAAGRESIVLALEAFLQGRQRDFLDYLEKYDPATRNVFSGLLPTLARLTQKKLNEMSPVEANGFHDQLSKVIQCVLPRTDLVIDNICLCEWVKAFGNYQPMPDSHVYQASTPSRTGERIQLYVELRNFACIKIGEFYEIRLASVVEIRDSKDNKVVWSHSFDEKGHVIRSRSLLHDYFNNYSFYLPSLPHGNYSLTIHIEDLTRSDAPRTKSKSINFRVGSAQK